MYLVIKLQIKIKNRNYLQLVSPPVISGHEDGLDRIYREEFELPIKKLAKTSTTDDLGMTIWKKNENRNRLIHILEM